MKVAIYSYKAGQTHRHAGSDEVEPGKVQLVWAFGAKKLLARKDIFIVLQNMFPKAQIASCSTAGEIFHTAVNDNTISITAIQFRHTTVQANCVNVLNYTNSFLAGADLAKQLFPGKPAYIMLLSDGSLVNATQLLNGIKSVNDTIPITGGLAGDGSNFTSTVAGLNTLPAEGNVVGIAFYGSALQISHAAESGWKTFGVERTITASKDNIVYSIDGANALDLYKTYLGSYANDLPSSALLFPLSVLAPGSTIPLVRTILKIDQENKAMIFAGDVPQGSQVRFMRANFDKLIDAAHHAVAMLGNQQPPRLALVISCIGRKLVLGARTEEEVETIADALGQNTLLSGFYSYGEIAPFNQSTGCELHNQTISITTFSEIC